MHSDHESSRSDLLPGGDHAGVVRRGVDPDPEGGCSTHCAAGLWSGDAGVRHVTEVYPLTKRQMDCTIDLQ